MSHVLCFALAVAALGSGCTKSDGAEYTQEDREEFLEASVHAPREFTFVHTSATERIEVRGRVEDDYRYQATVTVGDTPTYEEVDIDDRRMLRLLNPGQLPAGIGAEPALAALSSGAWVADAAGAPAEFQRSDAAVRLLGPDLVVEKVRALELPVYDSLFQERIKGAQEYDPKSVRYVRRTDKFPGHREDGARFDVFPQSYQPDLVFKDGVPDDLEERLPTYFLYASFWYDGKHLTRVELFFDIDTKRVTDDVRAAMKAQADRTGAPFDPSRMPPVPQPYRDSFTFRYPGEPVKVTVPQPTTAVVLPTLDAVGRGSRP